MSLNTDLAERLTEAIGTKYPSLGTPADSEFNLNPAKLNKKHSVDTVSQVTVSNPFFTELLKHWVSFQDEFTELRQGLFPPLQYRHTVKQNNNGEIVCHSGVFIHDSDGGSFLIEPNIEAVSRLILGDHEGLLSERVCVAAYLVCLFSQAVSFDSRFISAIRFLVSFVRNSRLHDSNYNSDNTDDNGNDRENESSIHNTDSTSTIHSVLREVAKHLSEKDIFIPLSIREEVLANLPTDLVGRYREIQKAFQPAFKHLKLCKDCGTYLMDFLCPDCALANPTYDSYRKNVGGDSDGDKG